MRAKQQAMALLPLVLCAVLGVVVSACGASALSASTAGAALPDSVRIDIDTGVTSSGGNPEVTLRDSALVRHLSATIYALPALAVPAQQFCGVERGPHYTLTFRER